MSSFFHNSLYINAWVLWDPQQNKMTQIPVMASWHKFWLYLLEPRIWCKDESYSICVMKAHFVLSSLCGYLWLNQFKSCFCIYFIVHLFVLSLEQPHSMQSLFSSYLYKFLSTEKTFHVFSFQFSYKIGFLIKIQCFYPSLDTVRHQMLFWRTRDKDEEEEKKEKEEEEEEMIHSVEGTFLSLWSSQLIARISL